MGEEEKQGDISGGEIAGVGRALHYDSDKSKIKT